MGVLQNMKNKALAYYRNLVCYQVGLHSNELWAEFDVTQQCLHVEILR